MAGSSLGLALLRERLEAALQRFLALDADSGRLLQPLCGKLVAVRVSPLTESLYFYHSGSGVQIHGRSEREADVTLSGSPWGFALAGLAESKDAALFGGHVRIDGDLDVARRFAGVLEALRIDWEGLLVRGLGHDLGDRLVTGLQTWHRWALASAATLRMDVTEYLQEEARSLPAAAEVEGFLRDVDTLRADSDRLAARIERLSLLSAGHPSS